jgi:glycosyltransferase involved in cell wall biosynthesis
MTPAPSPSLARPVHRRLVPPSSAHPGLNPRAPEPYFATPIAGTQAERRILLLSYHFPPSSAAGSLRWQKFAGLFAEQGWGLDVVALDPAQLKGPEPERYRDLPPGLRAYGVPQHKILIERAVERTWDRIRALRPRRAPAPSVPAGRPAAAPSIAEPPALLREDLAWRLLHRDGWRRAYYAWVRFAHDRAWGRRVTSLALQLVEPGVHRFVISCGPPQLVHEAGRAVAESTGLPFVVDMRDPWSLQRRLQEHVASPLYFTLATRAERRIVESASLVVMNTPSAADGMASAYPGKRVLSVLNGYDDEPLPPEPVRTRFIIAFAGSIYLDRDPRLVFRAAGRVVRDLQLTPAEFGFEFIGSAGRYAGRTLEEIAQEEGIAGFVRTGPARPRAEAMAFLAEGSVLLSLPQDSGLAIPSKIYEYMRFPAWMLALTEAGSATDRILAGTGVDVVRPDDVEGLAAVLRGRYQEFVGGVRPAPIARDPRLSRRHQAGLLLDALAEIMANREPVRGGRD